MPIDFQDIHQQVRRWGEQAPAHEQQLRRTREQASHQLDAMADQLEALRARVERAAAHNPGLRCAVPADEPLNERFALPGLPDQVAVLAADGSQINPDRHAAVEFCVINVGSFEMRSDPAFAPRERIRSQLLDNVELYTANGLITEEIVALRRDLEERRFLATLAKEADAPVIGLTDGPLELFRERESRETVEFRVLFQLYLEILGELAGLGVSTAGYVDKPRGDLVVRLLELSLLKEGELNKAGKERPLAGVTDADLFRERLEPGQRSAVFAIQSSSAQHFQGELSLHFFYLNVGRPEHPWITRTEIPAWVAHDPARLDPLQAVLVSQCRMLGTRPYPYVLHRAHEVAVVSLAEKDQLEQMIIAEMYRRGIPVGEKSYKQSHKELAGRTRYPR